MPADRAGELRDKIGFYQPVASDDGYGNTTNGFSGSATFTCAANIKPKLGGEQVLSGRLTGTNLVNVTVRVSSSTNSVTTAWKAKDERKGVAYNVRSIIDPFQGTSKQGRFLEMLCEQGVAI